MFRFTIRELVLATALVALAVGWWLDRTRLARLSVQAIPPAREERFELIETGKDRDKLYLFNPRTGQTWERYSAGEWTNFAKFPNQQ